MKTYLILNLNVFYIHNVSLAFANIILNEVYTVNCKKHFSTALKKLRYKGQTLTYKRS